MISLSFKAKGTLDTYEAVKESEKRNTEKYKFATILFSF